MYVDHKKSDRTIYTKRKEHWITVRLEKKWNVIDIVCMSCSHSMKYFVHRHILSSLIHMQGMSKSPEPTLQGRAIAVYHN